MTTLSGLTSGTWNIDPAHSTLGFTVRHMVVSKVRGKFEDFSSTLTVGQDLVSSTVEATVQMGSVTTGQADRDNHLRTGDFFEVEKFPTMTFTSTSATSNSLTGDLTIKGITHPVTFDVDFGGVITDPYGNQRAGFEANAEINRKDFGVTIDMPMEGGGAVVGDKVKLTLEVEYTKA